MASKKVTEAVKPKTVYDFIHMLLVEGIPFATYYPSKSAGPALLIETKDARGKAVASLESGEYHLTYAFTPEGLRIIFLNPNQVD
jgi:hypothetical protein